MVKHGKHSVELVHAETREPFPEHTAPNGNVYVEVEPDTEYFIRLKTDSEDVVLVYMSVDGEDLGHETNLDKDCPPYDEGVWKYENGKEIITALKFAKAPVRDAMTNGAAPGSWTGNVEVEFREAVYSHTYEQENFACDWNGGDVGYVMGISDPDKKKGVRTEKGTTFEAMESKRSRAQYSAGRHLTTITLNYCSVLGLIHAGILPQPPLWELHRLISPRVPEEDREIERREPTTMTVMRTIGNIEQEVQVEAFDLTDVDMGD